ncbi:hypothetical protein PV326_006450 [Microctonus aethiopoides]|nr:hypothetical protein PV326_006450 [Microctonus aethiopoides]
MFSVLKRASRYAREIQMEWDDLPRQYKTTNSWVIRNYHGIYWENGDIPYDKLCDILEIIMKDVNYIYVKDDKTIAYIKYAIYIPCEWMVDVDYENLMDTLYNEMEYYVDVNLNYDGFVSTKYNIPAYLIIDNIRKFYWFKRIRIEDDDRPPTNNNNADDADADADVNINDQREMQEFFLQNWIAADSDDSGFIFYEEEDD